MRVLIIGYGSIGKRHEDVLCSLNDIKHVDIVTKQTLEDKIVFRSLETVPNLQVYDYFIIASETNKHYEQLKYLESKVSDKIIFCEKPLFETKKSLKILKNSVYIGYVLRFHPLMKKLKKLLENEKIININVTCGQYLPTWRADSDYKESYSAKKNEGGGVLLDLSHEIDYTQWLCGKMKEIKSYQVKVSDLEIDSDDLTTFIGKTDSEVMVNLSIDYISKITYRRVLIHTLANSYELDFINNNLMKKDKLANEEIFTADNLQRNTMFEDMHKSILKNKSGVCSYNEALDIMNTITTIQEQNR